MNRRSPIKQFLPAIALILTIGIVVAIYGFNRQSSPAKDSPTNEQQIALALKLMQKGEPEKAVLAIDEMRGPEAKKDLSERAQLIRLQALDQAGMFEDLSTSAESFVNEFSESEALTEVELLRLSSEIATAGLSKPGLLKSVDDFIRDHPDNPGVAKLQVARARHEIALGDHSAARRRLNQVLADAANTDEATLSQVYAELGDLNLKALLNGDAGTDTLYTVKKGDSIWLIAQRHDVTSELLMKANNISDPSRLRVGQTLRVPSVDFALTCQVDRNEMILTNHGEFFKRYVVRTGREAGATPEGTFKVLNKKTDPTWRPGDGRVYLPGDPNNELGSRWMAFEGDILGIHGTIHPETVGNYASNGCIGLTREDVEELFDLVMVGTTLTIKGTQDLTQHKIIPAPEVPAPMSKTQIAQLRN